MLLSLIVVLVVTLFVRIVVILIIICVEISQEVFKEVVIVKTTFEFVQVKLLVHTVARIFGEFWIPAFFCTVLTAPLLGLFPEAGAPTNSDAIVVTLGEEFALDLGEG